MQKAMHPFNKVQEMLIQGRQLILAGTEEILRRLPAGNWIGGSTPYFMAENGGLYDQERILVIEIPSYMQRVTIKKYDAAHLSGVYLDAPDNGFSVIIIPAASPAHRFFALNAHNFAGFAMKPLIGWVSGGFWRDIGRVHPKVFLGKTQEIIENDAVVMHVELPAEKYALIHIVNIFKQGGGEFLTFSNDGFCVTDAYINGQKMNLVDYITAKNIDTHLPLVADYCGVMINASFRQIDPVAKQVHFCGPVFSDLEYKLAAPIDDYFAIFQEQMPWDDVKKALFSCNSILDYLYKELEEKQTSGITGPVAYGEVAYQLLNQTMVYLTIEDLTWD